jgi:hypothetical protein
MGSEAFFDTVVTTPEPVQSRLLVEQTQALAVRGRVVCVFTWLLLPVPAHQNSANTGSTWTYYKTGRKLS